MAVDLQRMCEENPVGPEGRRIRRTLDLRGVELHVRFESSRKCVSYRSCAAILICSVGLAASANKRYCRGIEKNSRERLVII